MNVRLMNLVLPLVLAIGSAHAATIQVPQDYLTIKAANAAAHDGDEIVVSPGVYNENVELDHLFVLRSTFDGHDWSIVENTVIKAPNTNLPAVIGSINSFGKLSTIRGFRITRDPITVTGFPVDAEGINGPLNIEYNIIENQVNVDPINGTHVGGAIVNDLGGTIQNNIIRNNQADGGSGLAGCSQGIIRNNVFYGNRGDSIVGGCSSKLLNNTFSNNISNVAISFCSGEIDNNIVWEISGPARNVSIGGSSTPSNCLLHGYTGPGTGNIDADPKFANPANGDFHLQPSSPCIGKGLARPDVKADFGGVQRGLKTSYVPGGAGPTDIGAFEFVPKPVAVWLEDGGPDQIAEGQKLAVGWTLDLYQAGTAINLRLIKNGYVIDDFGDFWNPAGADIESITLPAPLAWLGEYRLEGRSSYDHSLTFTSPPFAIQGTLPNAARRGWAAYP